MPSVAALRAHPEGETLVWTAADVDVDTARTGLNGSPTQVVKTYVPDRGRQTVELAGDTAAKAAALAEMLKNEEAGR